MEDPEDVTGLHNYQSGCELFDFLRCFGGKNYEVVKILEAFFGNKADEILFDSSSIRIIFPQSTMDAYSLVFLKTTLSLWQNLGKKNEKV